MTILRAYATLGELISHLTGAHINLPIFLIRLFSHRLSGCSLVVVKELARKEQEGSFIPSPRNR